MSIKTIKERVRQKRVRSIHGREFVEMLDRLIIIRSRNEDHEQAELLKRNMADYLNDIDRTGGIQVHG